MKCFDPHIIHTVFSISLQKIIVCIRRHITLHFFHLRDYTFRICRNNQNNKKVEIFYPLFLIVHYFFSVSLTVYISFLGKEPQILSVDYECSTSSAVFPNEKSPKIR
jgi:hypothetical protein